MSAARIRVVAVRLSALGDVVQTTGAVLSLREALPDAELVWVVQRPFAPLLEGLCERLTVLSHDRAGGWRAFLRTAGALRAWRPDVALDLQGNWKSAGLARLCGARRRIGAAAAARRERSSARLLGETVPAGVHPAAQALAVVRRLAPGAREHMPRLCASAVECERERRALMELGVAPDRPFRVLVLGDPGDPRSIRPAALAREAAAVDRPSVAVAGPAESTIEPPPRVPRIVHRPGEVRRLVALGAVVAACGGDVVGPDKGATHVLAAAGAPTIALFGPTDPQRTGPPAARALVALAAPDCAPCRSRTCRHADGPVCMDFSVVEGRAT